MGGGKRINGRTMNGRSCLNGVLKRTRNRAVQFTRNSRNCDIRVSLRFPSRRGRIWLFYPFQRSRLRLSANVSNHKIQNSCILQNNIFLFLFNLLNFFISIFHLPFNVHVYIFYYICFLYNFILSLYLTKSFIQIKSLIFSPLRKN